MTQTKKKAATVRCGDRQKSPASRPSPSLVSVASGRPEVKPSALQLVAWQRFFDWAFGVESTEAAS